MAYINDKIDRTLYDENGNYTSVWDRKAFGTQPLDFTIRLNEPIALALLNSENAKSIRALC